MSPPAQGDCTDQKTGRTSASMQGRDLAGGGYPEQGALPPAIQTHTRDSRILEQPVRARAKHPVQ